VIQVFGRARIPAAAQEADGGDGTGAETRLLQARNLTVRFGAVVAVDDVSFTVGRGELVGLIGPNGAGKTTVFNCLSRLVVPQRGSIEFEGRDLLARRVWDMNLLGISRTFQQLQLFRSMTVLENVLVGCQRLGTAGVFSAGLWLPKTRRDEDHLLRHAVEVLEMLDLTRWAQRKVAGLPYGIQKRVDIARALASEPKLLLLDEPAAGLNVGEVEELADRIEIIRRARTLSILLVEHHMALVMRLCSRIIVLNFGREIAQGTPVEVQAHPAVIEAYLGTRSHEP
jgi:branched-chain amino acid transport system ATP-binding protein